MKYLIIIEGEEFGIDFDLKIIDVPVYESVYEVLDSEGIHHECVSAIPLFKFKRRFEKRIRELKKVIE